MNSARNLLTVPAGTPLLADDLVEFHASRILLLLFHRGQNQRIEGLTKLAKLDFFVRYPGFFEKASRASGKAVRPQTDVIESRMVTFHYGPWDRRYYHVLGYLEARRLIEVKKLGKSFEFELTNEGAHLAESLGLDQSFNDLVIHMKEVKRVFGRMSGSSLKKLIYEVFEQEVAQQEFGGVIEP